MMKQMKLKKVILGVLIITLGVLGFFSTTAKNTVNAANKTCNNAGKLQQHYGMKYDWSDDDRTLIFSVQNGSFRITKIDHPELFVNSFTKGDDGFYKVDGKEATLDKDHKLKLTLKSNTGSDNDLVMRMALSKTDTEYNCLSMPEFNKAKAENKKDIATFETGDIDIALPKGNLANTDVLEDNTNYNGLCVALREGKDPTNTINTSDVNYLKLWDASYIAEYQALMPGCWSTKTSDNYSQEDMLDMVRIILSSTYEKNHSTVGDGETDNGRAWLINFNDVKAAAEAQDAGKSGADKHVYYTDANRKFYNKRGGSLIFDFTNENKAIGMKCNTRAKSNTDYTNLLEHVTDKDGKSQYNINANTQDYYAKNIVEEKVTYTWNYTEGSGEKTVETKDACSRTCEEALEVKYGPPVASKAGLCFEYQVQVTSRVRCTSKILIGPPKQPKVCNPIPYCNSIPGYIHQAGANDEYRVCINKCDGGKYTKTCSNKCYTQVYEKNKKATKTSNNEEVIAEKLSGVSFNGHYEWSGGSIVWRGSGYARYYHDFEYSRTVRDHGRYVPHNGFKTRVHSDGSLCKDHCVFRKCGKKQYLNKSEAHKDYKANLKIYDAAIAACKASAKCTTKTAKFTISTNYKSGKGDTIKVNYPFDEINKDATPEKLKSSDKESECKNPMDVKKDADIILNYDGCYKKCGDGLQYHTRWSFPGTWLNKKTGELTFGVPSSTTGWTNEEKKFCMPLDARDVNEKWWKYYYALYTANHITSFNTDAVKEKCMSYANESGILNVTSSDIESWNIKASTREFGYYGWNLDISCFYALSSKGNKVVEDYAKNAEKCNTSTSDSKVSYKIRTVNLKEMFPDSKTGSGSRAPGFNWSNNANILATNGKNKDYQSTPSIYAEKVQSEQYRVYNKNNIDYEFNLTKDMLKKVKAKERTYTEFKGNMVTRHGVYSYESSAIRDGGDFASSGNLVLDTKLIGCNNVEKYDSADCDYSVHKVGD